MKIRILDEAERDLVDGVLFYEAQLFDRDGSHARRGSRVTLGNEIKEMMDRN